MEEVVVTELKVGGVSNAGIKVDGLGGYGGEEDELEVDITELKVERVEISDIEA